MWHRIYLASNIVFLCGILVFFLGEHLVPGWGPVTLPVGGIVAGLAGIAAGVSGSVLIFKPDAAT